MAKDNGHKFYFKMLHPHRKPGDFRKVKFSAEHCTRCGLKEKYAETVQCPARKK